MAKINTVQELIAHLQTFDPTTPLDPQVPSYEDVEEVNFYLSTENILMQNNTLYFGVSTTSEDDEYVDEDEDDCQCGCETCLGK